MQLIIRSLVLFIYLANQEKTMEHKDNGGPAFPIPSLQNDSDFNCMTLRDYFAAKAMQGFCVNDWPVHSDESVSRLASFAYMMADAMLEARK